MAVKEGVGDVGLKPHANVAYPCLFTLVSTYAATRSPGSDVLASATIGRVVLYVMDCNARSSPCLSRGSGVRCCRDWPWRPSSRLSQELVALEFRSDKWNKINSDASPKQLLH